MTDKCAPLYNLLKDDVKWVWDANYEATFKRLKNVITSDNVLVHHDPNGKLVLECVASPVEVGAVMTLIKDGQEQPIAFVSRTLTLSERS